MYSVMDANKNELTPRTTYAAAVLAFKTYQEQGKDVYLVYWASDEAFKVLRH